MSMYMKFFTTIFSVPEDSEPTSPEHTKQKQNSHKKESVSGRPDFLKSAKKKDIYEANPWEGMEESDPFEKPLFTHKSRKDMHSTSTATSYVSPVKTTKISHKHTKSLVKKAGEGSAHVLSIHEGQKEVFEGAGAPLLFAKGGYDKHVQINEVKPNHTVKKSISQNKTKGGFQIIEKEELDEPEEVYHHVRLSSFRELEPPAFLRGGISDYDSEEDNFLAGKLDFSPKKKNSPQKKDVTISEANEPLFNIELPKNKNPIQPKSAMLHRRFASTTPKILSVNDVKDPLLENPRQVKVKSKISLSPCLGDNSIRTADTFERSYSCYKSEAPMSLDFYGPGHSKNKSVFVMEDQTSDLDIDIDEVNERSEFVNSRDNGSLDEEITSQTNPLVEKLIEEYKAIQEQKLYTNGVYVMPTSNYLVWNCLIVIRGGHYEKAKFKFRIDIPQTYPAGNLIVHSETKIYHPLVNIETGELDLKLFAEPSENKIAKLVLFIKSVFNESKYMDKLSSFNEEAGNRFVKNPYYFKIKAKESVKATAQNTLTESSEIKESVIEAVRKLAKENLSTKVSLEDKVNSLINSVKRNAMTSL